MIKNQLEEYRKKISELNEKKIIKGGFLCLKINLRNIEKSYPN